MEHRSMDEDRQQACRSCNFQFARLQSRCPNSRNPQHFMDTSPEITVNVGLRIKYARELLRLTQEQVSARLGFNDRQTLSDIENGKRAVKPDELLRFSDVLDQDLEFFVDPFSVVAEAQYSWRASPSLAQEELDEFEEKASGWVGMLRWLRSQQPTAPRPLGFALRLEIHSTFEAAQRAAEQLVDMLRLGPVPSLRLAECIEQELDIPVLFVDADVGLQRGSISGAACHLPELGVILVNRRESAVRRNFDLAHELFHSLTWERMKPEHRESNSSQERQRTRRVEQLADNFAAALLMPGTSLDALIDPERQRDETHLAEVAGQLRVSVDALGWRLRSLGRIDEQTRMRLSQVRRRSDVAGDVPKLFSERFVRLLHFALSKGRLTARKASKSLSLPLDELAGLFREYGLPDPLI
jgi:Zn-dependent peptidase ImmA (M78 family)/DNA-binding XRE family transcriptional regulator